MIEDELHSLLAARADAVPANLHRAAEVRARISGIRRRRAAGAGFALVLIALAGLLLTRLPGRPDALPTGVPPGPWYVGQPFGLAVVPGWATVDTIEVDGPVDWFDPISNAPFGYLVVLRCERPGSVVVRNLNRGGPSIVVPCDRRQGGHLEGVARIEPDDAQRLLAQVPDAATNVRFEPDGTGATLVTLMRARAREPLQPWVDEGPPLVEGVRHPAGTTFGITVPGRVGVSGVTIGITVDCVAGVRLEFTGPAGALATVTCDPLAAGPPGSPEGMREGRQTVYIPADQVARAGLRPGRPARLTVRSVGRDTDQWRVAFVN